MTEFIVMTAIENMNDYGKVAVVEVEDGVVPKMITERALGLVKIMELHEHLYRGGPASAFEIAFVKAKRAARILNLRASSPIKTWSDDYAGLPASMRWRASVGDYDLDTAVGTGATPEAAIDDLLDLLETEMFISYLTGFFRQHRYNTFRLPKHRHDRRARRGRRDEGGLPARTGAPRRIEASKVPMSNGSAA